MYLSDLPTIYDLTPDYAGNLAADVSKPVVHTTGYIPPTTRVLPSQLQMATLTWQRLLNVLGAGIKESGVYNTATQDAFVRVVVKNALDEEGDAKAGLKEIKPYMSRNLATGKLYEKVEVPARFVTGLLDFAKKVASSNNLAGPADLFWPGDTGRWQSANLADLSPAQDMLKWALLVGGVGYIFYKTVGGGGFSGYSAPRRRRRSYRRR